MKKIKLLTSLTSIGVLGTSVPLVATSCSNNKATINIATIGTNCGYSNLSSSECLFVYDYAIIHQDANFIFWLSEKVDNAEFEAKLGDESLKVTPVGNYYLVTIPAAIASAIARDKTGESLVISEKNNKVQSKTIPAVKCIVLTEADNLKNVQFLPLMNPYEIYYIKKQESPEKGEIDIHTSVKPEAASASDPISFKVTSLDGQPYNGVTASFIKNEQGAYVIHIEFLTSLEYTPSGSAGVVLSVTCNNATEYVEPFTFLLNVKDE